MFIIMYIIHYCILNLVLYIYVYGLFCLSVYLSVFFLSQAVFAKEKEEQRAKVRYTMNLPKCEGAARALIQ